MCVGSEFTQSAQSRFEGFVGRIVGRAFLYGFSEISSLRLKRTSKGIKEALPKTLTIEFCRNSPQPCLDPPKSEWHDGQRRINDAGTFIREKTDD